VRDVKEQQHAAAIVHLCKLSFRSLRIAIPTDNDVKINPLLHFLSREATRSPSQVKIYVKICRGDEKICKIVEREFPDSHWVSRRYSFRLYRVIKNLAEFTVEVDSESCSHFCLRLGHSGLSPNTHRRTYIIDTRDLPVTKPYKIQICDMTWTLFYQTMRRGISDRMSFYNRVVNKSRPSESRKTLSTQADKLEKARRPIESWDFRMIEAVTAWH
jgi:hypothetical protein